MVPLGFLPDPPQAGSRNNNPKAAPATSARTTGTFNLFRIARADIAAPRANTTHSQGPAGAPGAPGTRGPPPELDVVVTCMLTVSGSVPSRLPEEGVSRQLAPVGAPPQATATFPFHPPSGVIVTVKLAANPLTTVWLTGEGETEKSCPIPDSATCCGLPGALSFRASMPDTAPPALGLNVTLTVHEALAASDVPQLLLSAKSPEALMPVKV